MLRSRLPLFPYFVKCIIHYCKDKICSTPIMWRHEIIFIIQLCVIEFTTKNKRKAKPICTSTSWLVHTKLDPLHNCHEAPLISHNSPFGNKKVHMCEHFSYKMVHFMIFVQCNLLFVRWVYGTVLNRNMTDTKWINWIWHSSGKFTIPISLLVKNDISLNITVTSYWRRMRLKSPASRLFTQPFIWVLIKENTKAPRRWPLCGEFTGDQWIPRTNGQ